MDKGYRGILRSWNLDLKLNWALRHQIIPNLINGGCSSLHSLMRSAES